MRRIVVFAILTLAVVTVGAQLDESRPVHFAQTTSQPVVTGENVRLVEVTNFPDPQ